MQLPVDLEKGDKNDEEQDPHKQYSLYEAFAMLTDEERILTCNHHDPFTYLGAHFGDPNDGMVTIRCFQPHAKKVYFVQQSAKLAMSRIHPDGIFTLTISIDSCDDPTLNPFSYQFEIHNGDAVTLINDPYRFAVLLGEMDQYLFNSGQHYLLYNKLGAQREAPNNISGIVFRVWAPNARAVSVIGDFNRWDGRVHQMRTLGASGIWELFVPHLGARALYKFQIKTQGGEISLKSDPFQFYGEIRPNTASMTAFLDDYKWHDSDWLRQKVQQPPYDQPLAIYEVHPGTWQRDPKDPERFMTWSELADHLVPYVVQLGFTHIELMPVMEHPLDESWGYQVTGPFSITSRYGTPGEFMYFVDTCHQHGIGVILDWVPAHFPKDSHSLARFDGTALYEHDDTRRGTHPEWGTLIYNYGRNEVSNYLIANALFWLDKYHIDGLRVDAVASMLYLDYSRQDGDWLPNKFGGRENLEAIEFMRHLNSVVYDRFPNTLMIAEESTSFYGVSRPTDQGGLGFGFKWNMGWMNDNLEYFRKDPIHRKFHHNTLTFSLVYAFTENFILPLSHDEVVHGKRSLLDKMPGDLWQKFANLRLLYLWMWLHPGKKLLFMGGEFGQWLEWNCKRSLDWHLLEDEQMHNKLYQYMRALNSLYREQPALWQRDFDSRGFSWLDLEDRDNSVISFARYAEDRQDHLVCLLNFTPQLLRDYRLPLAADRPYERLFCSDLEEYGGSGHAYDLRFEPINAQDKRSKPFTRVTVPPLGGLVLKAVSN
jgi:1,4-alpha-glucan branching enzyme